MTESYFHFPLLLANALATYLKVWHFPLHYDALHKVILYLAMKRIHYNTFLIMLPIYHYACLMGSLPQVNGLHATSWQLFCSELEGHSVERIPHPLQIFCVPILRCNRDHLMLSYSIKLSYISVLFACHCLYFSLYRTELFFGHLESLDPESSFEHE